MKHKPNVLSIDVNIELIIVYSQNTVINKCVFMLKSHVLANWVMFDIMENSTKPCNDV